MESPAKGDSRQGVKASQKHLEFQLQREKAYTRELEEKIKSQQAHIAKLEQDKAELRREMITLVEDDKKKTKLEEKCHLLQKEMVEKQAALAAEQKRASAAECEKEQIRRDAHASIAKWCEAEKQWIAENEVLQKELDDAKEAFAKLKSECDVLIIGREDALKQLQREKERFSKIETTAEAAEKKIASLHSRIEALQNDIYTRDETVFKLDEAGTKWQEICHSKDEEIKALEVQAEKHLETIEKLQSTISLLNQRIEAAKILNLEEKGRVEKVLCDLRESEKEKKLLQMDLETVRRDLEYASQNAAKHQELVADLRTKLAASSEQVKERNAELRKQELSISQLTAEVKRVELERTDSSYMVTSLENQLQELRDTLAQMQSVNQALQEKNVALEAEVQQVKRSHEGKDEAAVLMKSEFEDKIEVLLGDIKNLESEVSARQQVINSMTTQLGEANMKNEELHSLIIQGSDTSKELSGVIEDLQKEKNKLSLDQLRLQQKVTRLELCEEHSIEFRDALLIHSAKTLGAAMEYMGEVERLKMTVDRLDTEKNATVTRLDAVKVDLEEEIQLLKEREVRLINEIEARNGKIVALEETLQKCEDALSVLRKEIEVQQKMYEKIQSSERLLGEKLAETECLLQQTSNVSEKQLYVSQYATRWLDIATQSLMFLLEEHITWISEKIDIVFTGLESAYAKENEQIMNALNASNDTQKEAEERCAHLELRLSEAESHLGEREKTFAKISESHMIKVRAADNQRDLAEKARDDLSRRLKSLTEKHEGDVELKDERIRELTSRVEAERRNGQLIEEKVQKLRRTLDYELGRKGDYKRALEEVKSKREEAEKYRATEKDWAMKAINRANEEVNYWVRSFDKLKSMLDEMSKRSGTRVSAVDQATIRKFEEAKNRLTLRDQDVNITPQEEENRREKRQRIEF
ncbi:BRCT domain-containing protein [Trypanosoma grayi]|uniref:BRCT domain-containing protein n=1 Tax=Trypanosoma grayi TaxID=71804 RepID=UPI0004F49CD0|nr:BRCT domain-containing protein [Trypanosoma grayi]KEG12383.1 BRCT domain-containing protein [Trypanosoma grayi]